MGEGALLPEMIREPNGEKKDSSCFLARTQSMESHGLYVFYSPPPNFFLYKKSVLLPLLCRDLHVACHGCKFSNCNSLLIPSEPIFAGEIPDSLFCIFCLFVYVFWQSISGQQFFTLQFSWYGDYFKFFFFFF